MERLMTCCAIPKADFCYDLCTDLNLILLVADDDDQTLIKLSGKRYKSSLHQFLPPMVFARQYLSNAKHNIWKFIKRDFHTNTGMIYLVNEFYRSISEDGPLPIPYREILLTTKIMDRIFERIGAERVQEVS